MIPRTRDLKCSFCGKSEREVEKLVAGPKGIFICDSCVATASALMSAKPQNAEGDAR